MAEISRSSSSDAQFSDPYDEKNILVILAPPHFFGDPTQKYFFWFGVDSKPGQQFFSSVSDVIALRAYGFKFLP